MDDQVLIHILENACCGDNLIFQVVEQDRHLHLFLNREPEQVLNYQAVGKKIYQALNRLSLTDIDGVCLYSRVLGEEEPDWEARFRLPQAQAAPAKPAAQLAQTVQNQPQHQMNEAETYVMQDVAAQRAEVKKTMAKGGGSQAVAQRSATAVAASVAAAANYPLSDQGGAAEAAADYEAAEAAAPTVSAIADVAEQPVGKPQIDAPAPLDEDFALSDHCFIRNRMLLTADILPPSKAVAKQLNGFHEFSMAEKQRMMPQLELFFKGAPSFSAEGLTEAQQAWFQEMDALEGDDTRKAPIWLSRYCADAGATLDVVARVFDPSLGVAKKEDEAVEEPVTDAQPQGGAAHSISGSVTGGIAAPPRSRSQLPPESPQDRLGSSNGMRSRQPSSSQSTGQPARAAERKPDSVSQWLWPGIVVMVSICLMCLGMLLAKQPAAIATDACLGSDYPEQCHLATQIVGDSEVWDAMKMDALPLPANGEMRENQFAFINTDCSRAGAANAGHGSAQANNPAVAATRPLQVQPIFPGVLLADVEYPEAEGPGTVRTACLFSHEVIPGTVSATQVFEMGSATIPTNWPAEAYEAAEMSDVDLRVNQAFHPLFTIGSTLLFTTVGLFAAALLRMAVTTHNLTALSQAAIVMGIFEAIFEALLPLGGLLFFPVIIARNSLALGLTGAIVPGFKVDWSGGYMSVAGCVAMMILVRFVLRWLMILTILGGNFA